MIVRCHCVKPTTDIRWAVAMAKFHMRTVAEKVSSWLSPTSIRWLKHYNDSLIRDDCLSVSSSSMWTVP
eukprot:3322627-Amphidinium_carterae.2